MRIIFIYFSFFYRLLTVINIDHFIDFMVEIRFYGLKPINVVVSFKILNNMAVEEKAFYEELKEVERT